MMHETKNLETPPEDVLMAEIRRRKVKMRPHLFFVMGTLLAGIGVAGLFLVAAWTVSIVLFEVTVVRPQEFLGIGGGRGVVGFLRAFPWGALGLGVLALAGGLTVLRRYDFSYRYRFTAILLIATLVVLGVGLAFDRVGVPERGRERGDLAALYSPESGDQWLLGRVSSSTGESTVTLELRDGGRVALRWESGVTKMEKSPTEGDIVRAVGKYDSEGLFVATGISVGRGGEGKDFQRGGRKHHHDTHAHSLFRLFFPPPPPMHTTDTRSQ